MKDIMEIILGWSKAFWNEDFWLPPNVTWRDIEPGNLGINHANYKHLIWSIPIAIILTILRSTLECYFFNPIGKYLGVKSSRTSRPEQNETLEVAYKKSKKLNQELISKLSKQLDWSSRQIDRWWRQRKAQDKPTMLKKFSENCWRCLMYGFNFTLGMYAMWDKKYLWDVLHCAYDYPHHAVDNGIWCYYMISMAFYWSLTYSQFTDNKRKDFWEMFAHHSICLLLFGFSWVCNIHRVGSLILVVHDFSDIFLDAAKCLKYANMKRSCDTMFGFFALSWVVTRLIIFPRILYACLFQTLQPFYPAYFFFNCLLVILLVLHFIWTYMIFQVIVQSLKSGEVNGDVRSSSECDLSDEQNDNHNVNVEGDLKFDDKVRFRTTELRSKNDFSDEKKIN